MINLLFLALAFSWMDIEFHTDQNLKKFYPTSTNLTNELSIANTAYYSGDLQAAKQKYLLLSLRAYDDNWDYYQRKIISYALLRLCQLDRQRCDDYITQLIYLDPDQAKQIDTDLFEPPLIEQALLQLNRLQSNFYMWQPTKEFEAVKYFIINGRIYTNSEGLTIPLPLTKQRILLVHSNYQSELFSGEVSAFLKWSPKGIKVSPITSLDTNLSPSNADEIIDTQQSSTWWQKNKKNVIVWSVVGGIAAYFIHKNQKSSDDGGPVSSTATSKE
ncbi:MAG: hypothetical protein KDD37_04705 [Bdellovibrionales bacterium]|nr:hypothetical protein [Bdellovibrionales bacterium]